MMRKMVLWGCLLGLLGLGGVLLAEDPADLAPEATPEASRNPSRREVRQMTPEELENHQRRYEIMVLMQAYRILPEEQKEAIKGEILKRMRVDYEANRARMERTIAKMEQDLARMKNRLDERTPEELIEAEFKRLQEMPIGGLGPGGWMPPPQCRDDNAFPDGKPRKPQPDFRDSEQLPPPPFDDDSVSEPSSSPATPMLNPKSNNPSPHNLP